jgi:hypothetical protein
MVFVLEANANCLLSGEKATVVTLSKWALNVCSSAPVAGLSCHGRPTLAACSTTTLTQFEWPLSVCIVPPVPAFRSFIVMSLDAVAMSLPSSENNTRVTSAECSQGGWSSIELYPP